MVQFSSFDPTLPISVEYATLLGICDLIASCQAFADIAEKTVGAEARTKVLAGPFPLAWEGGEYTKEQLAELFCTAQLHPPLAPEKSVGLDPGSYVAPEERGNFVLTIRRFVRPDEFNVDDGNSVYLWFLDQIGALETEMMTKVANLTVECPSDLYVARTDGPAFGTLDEEAAQGQYLWSRHLVTWGRLGGGGE